MPSIPHSATWMFSIIRALSKASVSHLSLRSAWNGTVPPYPRAVWKLDHVPTCTRRQPHICPTCRSPHFSQFHIFECSSSMHVIILLDKRRLWVKPHKSRWEWEEILILSWMAIFNLVPCHMCLGSSTEIIHPSSKLKTARRRSIFSLFCRWTV